MQVPIKRPQETAGIPQEIFTLALQASFWPPEFPDNIDAPGNIFGSPKPIHYPHCSDPQPYPKSPEFRGWNCQSLKDNKLDLFNVVSNLNSSSSSLLYEVSQGGPILPWEQQLLFAVAMQVSL